MDLRFKTSFIKRAYTRMNMISKLSSTVENEIKLRSIQDFEPKQMRHSEKTELLYILKNLKIENSPFEGSQLISTKSDGTHYDYNAAAIPFQKGDKMKTIPPANIGDCVRWWMVRHLDSENTGFILRNRVIIENLHVPSKTTIYDLPLELLDTILEKSLLLWIMNFSPYQNDADVVEALSTVEVCWFERIRKQRIRKRIKHRIKEFNEMTDRKSAIIVHNRNFLLENIQSNDELIQLLYSSDCLTEEQRQFIQRQRTIQDKNDELLYLLRSFDQTKFSNVVRCLRQTNQKTVARIIENGGVAIKVEAQAHNGKGTVSMNIQKSFHQGIEVLRDRTKPMSHQTNKLVDQLKEEGIEILNCQMVRQTVVVWIWCQSQTALQHIHRLYESNQLRDILFGLANIRPSPSGIIESISIDSNQFLKTVVVCPISVNLTQTIAVGVNEEDVLRLTKLRDEIYVLCQPNSAPALIRVFDDRNPYRLQREIEIKEIETPVDIVSSEKDNCIYVSDLTRKFIWKITRETTGQHKILKWLAIDDFQQSSLSMSSDGKLLVVNSESSVLILCEPDEELLSSIQFPREIDNQHHAETKIQETALSVGIESTEVEYYFYVSDQMGKCFWKIRRKTTDKQKIVKWHTTDNFDPSALSLFNSGRFLMVHSQSSILIYGSDAERIPSFKLPILKENIHRADTGVKEIQLSVCSASRQKDNCLFVSDQLGKCIWKINKETTGEKRIFKWLTVDNFELTNLSASSGGQLLVVDSTVSILMIYGSDAELIRYIKLPREIENPQHAVETSIENYVIVHQLEELKEEIESKSTRRKKDTKWVLSELTEDGQVIRRFIPSNEIQQLNYPSYLSLDSDDRVFVTDTDNERVILFDSDLKWSRILCPTKVEEAKDKIVRPEGVFYDEHKQQLIVGGLMHQVFVVNIYALSGI